eukprot:933212-Amphidinium_carterae.2
MATRRLPNLVYNRFTHVDMAEGKGASLRCFTCKLGPRVVRHPVVLIAFSAQQATVCRFRFADASLKPRINAEP